MKKHYDTFHKKLKSYSALAGSMLAIAKVSEGQIVYTDIEPDNTTTESTLGYSMDLNNDGNVDFSIYLLKYTLGNVVNNMVLGVASGGYYSVMGTKNSAGYIYPSNLNADETIGPDQEWHSYSSLVWVFAKFYSIGGGSPVRNGQWSGVKDQYTGLRITIDGEKFYGWARLDVDSNCNEFTIKDFAYESAHDKAIAAGDTVSVTAVPAVGLGNDIKIITYNENVFITTSESQHALITIANMQGSIIERLKIKQKQYQISLKKLPKGIYLVDVQQGNSRAVKKVLIQ